MIPIKATAVFLSKNLSYFILLTAILTYFSPISWAAPSWIPSVFLGFVILFTGLTMDTSAIRRITSKKKELFITVLLKWTSTLFISAGLGYLFFASHPEIAAGVILTGAVPSATAATLYTFMAGGNVPLVIVSSLLDVAISPVLAPLALLGLDGGQISISFLSLLKSFMIIVIIPLSAGLTLQRIFPGLPARSTYVAKAASSGSLLVVIHTLMASGKHYMADNLDLLPLLIFVMILQTVLPMIVNFTIASIVFRYPEDAKAALFQTSVNNAALAGIIAFEFFGGLAAMAPILGLILNLAIGAQIANFFSTRLDQVRQKSNEHAS